MQAIVIDSFGGPEVMALKTVPDPNVVGSQVVVELRYCALNFHDIILRRGGLHTALPQIIGIDGAGVRRDTGEEVVILPSLKWGPDSTAPGPEWSILGDKEPGTYAELIAVPAENLFPKPANYSWQETAALAADSLTAFRALFTQARLRPGETVLVLGAGGGLSTACVALAAAADTRVFVTSSRAEKIAAARERGATDGVLYTDPEWVSNVVALTGGGAHVVVDSVGRDMTKSLQCLRPGGRLIVLGAAPGALASFNVRDFYFRQTHIIGTVLGNAEEFKALLSQVATARWRPIIDSEFRLDQAVEAHQRMESGQHIGKILLQCDQ